MSLADVIIAEAISVGLTGPAGAGKNLLRIEAEKDDILAQNAPWGFVGVGNLKVDAERGNFGENFQTYILQQIGEMKARGETLLADNVVEKLIQYGAKNLTGAVHLYDGIPRRKSQVGLTEGCIFLDVPEDIAKERIMGRFTGDYAKFEEKYHGNILIPSLEETQNLIRYEHELKGEDKLLLTKIHEFMRKDDLPEEVEKRFVDYHNETLPAIEKFANEKPDMFYVVENHDNLDTRVTQFKKGIMYFANKRAI